jgi:hypothetical protein
VSNQNVTPATAIIADIIATTNPDNPEAEKDQLAADLAANTPEIALLVDAATALYNALLDAGINTDFEAALSDLLVDGSLDLPILQPVAPQVEQAVAEAEQQRGRRIEAAATGLLQINVAPTATADIANTLSNASVIIPVLNNDFDDNLDPLVITSVTQGASGTVGITDNNTTVTYTPGLNFVGQDIFAYTISDPAGLLATSMVTVSIEVPEPVPLPEGPGPVPLPEEPGPVPLPPVVANPIADVQARAGEPNRTLDLAGTFTDPDGDVLTLLVFANTNPSVVTATMGTGTNLILEFNNSGTATITVRAADGRGGTVETDFVVTVAPVPLVQPLANQQHVIGQGIGQLEMIADGCVGGCTFTVSNLPPDLQVDQATGRITGNIAFTAFTRGVNPDNSAGGPLYRVRVIATDANQVESVPMNFDWRITQGQITEQASPSGEAGDGDGDGDSADGDGGAAGDASDGGELSPIAGAQCKVVGLDGGDLRDNAGNVILIQADADVNGKFLLPIPHDPDNPDFVKALEGFIECHPPGKDTLVISTYLNTKGLRRGERLVDLQVDPTTTVNRPIFNGLNAANAATDLVAIHARLRDDIAGLETNSPSENRREEDITDCVGDCVPGVDPDCEPVITSVTNTEIPNTIDISLKTAFLPTDTRGRNARMASYIASQLFLAAFKEVGQFETLPEFACDEVALLFGEGPVTYVDVLNRYFSLHNLPEESQKEVLAKGLIDLGLKPDDVFTVDFAPC